VQIGAPEQTFSAAPVIYQANVTVGTTAESSDKFFRIKRK
jgi:hypothetical protein